jgi:hypothetical protein
MDVSGNLESRMKREIRERGYEYELPHTQIKVVLVLKG